VEEWTILFSVETVKIMKENRILRRSPAVARMADRTAPVVKLTLTLTLILPGPQQ